MQNYGPNFYSKLNTIASSLGVTTEDLVGLIASESGGNTSIVNSIGAAGLFQFIPSTLKDLGWTGTPQEFAKLSGEQQLYFFNKFAGGLKAMNGGPFKNGAVLYAAHFLPICLQLPGVKAGDFNTVIAELNPPSENGYSKKYLNIGKNVSTKTEESWVNANLGFAKSGKITLGNINDVLQNRKNSNTAKNIMKAINMPLKEETNLPVNNKAPVNNETPLNDNFKELNDELKMPDEGESNEMLMLSPAVHEVMNEALQLAAYKKLPENSFIVKIAADDFTTAVEFGRILALGYEDILTAKADTYVQNEFVEVGCKINGPKYICFAAAKQLTNAIKDTFIKQANINNIEFRFEEDKETSFKPINIKSAEIQYRKFLVKSLGTK